MAKRSLVIVTTGGTIEKTYDELEGSLDNRPSMGIHWVLSKLRYPHGEIKIKPLMAKDSLSMDDNDRDLIFKTLKNLTEQKLPLLILHGTDTMDQTVQYCVKKGLSPEMPIVFTGAMKPLGFVDSDATQNVTEAILTAFHREPGIYTCFHGEIFIDGKFEKNKIKGTFESL